MANDSRQDYTIHDRGGLKLRPDASDADINAAELSGASLAAEKYLARRPSRRIAPFTHPWMIRLHKEMFGRVWRWAGRLRQSNTNIGCDWRRIQEALFSLAADIQLWRGSPVDDAAQLHLRAIAIHPFQDGNGRWARLLANIWLAQKGETIVRWPEPAVRSVTSPIRQEYVSAIRAAEEQGNMEPFIALHKRFLGSSSPSTSKEPSSQ